MKKSLLLPLIMALLPWTGLLAQNPFITHMYTADPSARVFNDTLYIYPSHDPDTATWFSMEDWHVFSTTDMINWTDHGVALSVDDLSWADHEAWAPDCEYRNGKYYFYYPVEANYIGVAVGDKPYGKFTDPLGKPLITRETPGVVNKRDLIDPAIFTDDDGTPYLIFGQNDVNIVRLNEDMISFDDSVRVIEGSNDFFEAVWMHKYKGKYYLSYSGRGKILYGIGDSPYGPFTYIGEILDEVNSGTNHHSIVEYKGEWYLLYHNSDLYFRHNPDEEPVLNWDGNNPFRRSICVDRLYYNEDGTIRKVIPTDTGPLGMDFSPSDYDNPAVFEKGQNAAHAFHQPYNGDGEASLLLLNGNWKFKWVERPDLVPQHFEDPDFSTDNWDEIIVPSNWQMEGFGHPKFRNIALSFESDPPHIPAYYNPTGCYKRTFSVHEGWKDKELMLRFEGIKSASYVWVNGQKVGYNQGGFEPAEYNISPYVKEGANDISVQVIRFSDGSYLENQDMWRLSGIYRDVKISALPKVHVHDFYYTTDLDEAYLDAQLKVELTLANSEGRKASAYSLAVDVLDEEGSSILDEPMENSLDITGAKQQKIFLETHVKNPLLWSAEYPNLYSIHFLLKDDQGNTLESFSKTLGFREVEVQGEVLKVNGIPVKLNGVNSHMHHPEHGQAVPLETLRKDLLLMKQFNINCVRTSHYPPTPEYLDLADELGIYVIDEVGDEAHGNIQLSYDPTYADMYRDRSRKLVYRDRNHVSVLMWSAGNESGSGPNIQKVIETGLSIDPSRPAWMYGGNTFYIPFEPVTGPRYWTPIQLKNLAEGKLTGPGDLRPSFMDEYLAATGNGLGGMDEYWDLIWRYPRLSGGAIWDWISPGIYTTLWTTPDASGHDMHGAIMGRPVFTEGHQGRGLAFTGHDDWVEFYRDPSLDLNGNEITISFWVKPEEIPQPNNFIAKGKHGFGIRMDEPDTLEFYLKRHIPPQRLSLPYMDSQAERKSARAVVPENWYGNWHHVAGIYNGEELRLYINEELVAETECSGFMMDTPFPLCIGREAESQDQGEYSGRLSSMTIDQLRIFAKAIPIDEIGNPTSMDNAVLSLDFEEDEKGARFYSTGLGGRTYGIVWPDREIQPEIHQIKKSGQPLTSEAIHAEQGLFRIINRHHFKNLDDFDLSWQLLLDGDQVEEGKLDASLEAQSQAELTIPYTLPKEEGEVILTTSFTLKNPTAWAEAGYEVAFDQFIIRDAPDRKSQAVKGKIQLVEHEEQLSISGKDFTYTISKADGQFVRFEYQKSPLLEGGPLFNIWRAPLANDIDLWGSYTYSNEHSLEGLGRSIDNQLRTLGMRNMEVQLDLIEATKTGQASVEINILKYYNSSKMEGAFECREKYTILADGTIHINLEIIPHGNMPDILPRAGWQFELPKSFKAIEWYGRGIFETYPDRKPGAKVGIDQSTVDDEYVPYIIPQDNGTHSDVRWLKLQNEKGRGLYFMAEETMNFSYQKYSTDNMSRAVYTFQLKESETNTLNIDFVVSGVGGTAIRQLEKYRVKPSILEFNFTIQPF